MSAPLPKSSTVSDINLLFLHKESHFLQCERKCSSVARFTERLITYLSPKTYLTTHLRPKTCLIFKICIKTCHKSILIVN